MLSNSRKKNTIKKANNFPKNIILRKQLYLEGKVNSKYNAKSIKSNLEDQFEKKKYTKNSYLVKKEGTKGLYENDYATLIVTKYLTHNNGNTVKYEVFMPYRISSKGTEVSKIAEVSKKDIKYIKNIIAQAIKIQ